MKRIFLGTLILSLLAFGFAANASAVEIELVDGHSLGWMFGAGGVNGHMLTGADVAAFEDTAYDVLLFSAFSSSTNTKVRVGTTVLDAMNNTRDGNIGRPYGELVLGELNILYGNSYNVAVAENYGNGKPLQAYMLDTETTINGLVYGVGSIFIGFEDGTDFDYNDVVLAFRVAPAVPVPAAAWLLGTGLAGLMALRRKAA